MDHDGFSVKYFICGTRLHVNGFVICVVTRHFLKSKLLMVANVFEVHTNDKEYKTGKNKTITTK